MIQTLPQPHQDRLSTIAAAEDSSATALLLALSLPSIAPPHAVETADLVLAPATMTAAAKMTRYAQFFDSMHLKDQAFSIPQADLCTASEQPQAFAPFLNVADLLQGQLASFNMRGEYLLEAIDDADHDAKVFTSLHIINR